MDKYHCYNEECINGTAFRICTHDPEECKKDFYPAMASGIDPYFAYCSKECKAKVVMTTYSEDTKPRTVKEMQYRLGLMKKRVMEKQKVK